MGASNSIFIKIFIYFVEILKFRLKRVFIDSQSFQRWFKTGWIIKIDWIKWIGKESGAGLNY